MEEAGERRRRRRRQRREGRKKRRRRVRMRGEEARERRRRRKRPGCVAWERNCAYGTEPGQLSWRGENRMRGWPVEDGGGEVWRVGCNTLQQENGFG